ncbi:MAG: putative zinc-binding protein [Anaerolineaceae bacterium]|nr:putative zinc-binding protein [Anaerolineaceae bacterium]
MPDLPRKKVGIVSCSGEELAEGTVTRLAALQVLEKMRPGDTVTICLPLFLAGGEGDRAFAKFYPTIAIDGCEKRCAYRGTEMYSNKPAGSIVVTNLVSEQNLSRPEGKRKLNDAGMRVVDAVAQQVAEQVDSLLGKGWSRREGTFTKAETNDEPDEEVVAQQKVETQHNVVATCACGSGIPIQKITVNGQELTLIALPLIFQNFRDMQKPPSESALAGIMDMVKIYNGIEPADETAVREAVGREYQAYWQKHQATHE